MDGTTGAGERKLWFNEYGELVPLFLPNHNITKKLITIKIIENILGEIHLVITSVQRTE